MANIIGRGVRVEVALTYGTPIVVSAITKTDPAVMTLAAGHGQAAKKVGYLNSVEGMVQLEGQAVRIASVATNDATLEDVDTSVSADFTGAAEFVPVATWGTVAKATSYEIGGGDGDSIDTTVLLDDIKQEENGQLAAQTLNIGINSEDLSSAAMAFIKKAARNQQFVTFRITLKTGAVRVCRGQPSLPGESVQKSALGTGQFSVKVKGFVTEGAP
nr:phage tail tube protein [uncultured Roseateles sp.]